jgi:hypothetical protein
MGMRVKLRGTTLALKAQNSRAQGASPGNGHRHRISPKGAAQAAETCAAPMIVQYGVLR